LHCERIIDVLHEMSITEAHQPLQIGDETIRDVVEWLHKNRRPVGCKTIAKDDAYVKHDVKIAELENGWTVFGRCLAGSGDGKPMKFCNLYCNHDRVCQCALSIDEEEYIEFVKTSIQDHHVDFVCENACVSIDKSELMNAIRA